MNPEPTISNEGNEAKSVPTNGQAGRSSTTIRYLDLADMGETFADSITGRRYPACRLVLPPAAAVDLINRMQQIANALTQAGVVKASPRPGAEVPKAG